MADITKLILADHDWFREQFAKLDDLQAQTPIDHAALERDPGSELDRLLGISSGTRWNIISPGAM